MALRRRIRCGHLPSDMTPPPVRAFECEDCVAAGEREWVHLRFCQSCGKVGCCDNSPRRHATAHFDASAHPMIRSLEPGEDWWWCYLDRDLFFVDGSPPAPSLGGGDG